MTDRGARSLLADTLRRQTVKHALSAQRTTHYAVVQQVSPLQVELGGNRLLLTEDDLIISQWVRRYGYDYGLNVGDTVLVSHMPNDDFVVHDVIATAKIEQGLDNATDQIVDSGDPTFSGTAPAGGGAMTVTPDRHITKKQPVRDANGAVVGWVPIYTSLP